MTGKNLFKNIIYCGFHLPEDGLGNILSLLDRLVINDKDIKHKSICLCYGRKPIHKKYGKIEEYAHLKNPDIFKNSIFIDTGGVLTDEKSIKKQIERVSEYKKIFNVVTGYYLMWESDRLWEPMVNLIKAYDFCIVATNVLDEFLRKRGIDFVHLRHPYDFETVKIPFAKKTNKEFTFGISSCFWERKNIPLIVETFAKHFQNNPDFRLKIHTRFDFQHPTLFSEYKKFEKYLEKSNNIEILNKTLPRKKYLSWLNSIDVYCFISSCEGYSITPREALHLGKPTILLDSHIHKEFSHLPGIVKVRAGGKIKAKWWAQKEHDLGYYSSVNKKSLEKAFRYSVKNFAHLKKELKNNYKEILEFHDLKKIKFEWMRVLNSKYKKYARKENIINSGSKIIADEIFDMKLREPQEFGSKIVYSMDRDGIQCLTGEKIGDKVFCFTTKHKKGHCVYVPEMRPIKSFMLRATFFIEFINIFEEDEDLIGLYIYDSKHKKVLISNNIIFQDLKSMKEQFILEFKVAKSQVLELIIYWNKTCDIAVSKIVLEKI